MADQSNRRDYQYDTLPANHIRLLKLKPGPTTKSPQIEDIRSYPLAESPHYAALSYVWETLPIKPSRNKPSVACGDDKSRNKRSIACGDDQEILVLVNAFLTLKWLQEKIGERLLWIDSICINQNTDEDATKEREGQVKMMGEIYANAKTVFMHFGCHASGYDERAIQNLRQWIERNDESGKDKGDDDLERIEAFRTISKMSQESYFKRAWTIQEVIRAQEVSILFRHSILPWRELLEKTSRERSREDPFLILPVVAVQRYQKSNPESRLLDLLRITSRAEATRERDKIYALLGLINEGPQLYPVDYRDTSRTANIYSRYAVPFCQQSNSLDLLETSQHITEARIQHLPSWTNGFYPFEDPRFDTEKFQHLLSNRDSWCKTRFTAHGGHPLFINHDSEPDYATLEVRGQKVGDIVYVSPKMVGENLHPENTFNHFESLTRKAESLYGLKSSSEFLAAFICTKICDAGELTARVQEEVRQYVESCGADLAGQEERLFHAFHGAKLGIRFYGQKREDALQGKLSLHH